MRVLGYVRVSTEEQKSSGTGLQAQRRAIIAECERRGWHLVEVIEDAGFSAKDMKRPGVQEALRVLQDGKATALVVAKLDRLSRSMIDFTALDGDGAEAALGARGARLRRRHLDADRRGDGKHARHVRSVRTPADQPTHPRRARRQTRQRGTPRSPTGSRPGGRPAHPAPAPTRRLTTCDRGKSQPGQRAHRARRRTVVRGNRQGHPRPSSLTRLRSSRTPGCPPPREDMSHWGLLLLRLSENGPRSLCLSSLPE